jgi:endonuclease/exonuclease/phosphatase family metal-dependent hydrolase
MAGMARTSVVGLQLALLALATVLFMISAYQVTTLSTLARELARRQPQRSAAAFPSSNTARSDDDDIDAVDYPAAARIVSPSPLRAFSPSSSATSLRFSLMTLNAWGKTRWRERKAAFVDLFTRHRPDVATLQEMNPTLLAALDEALVMTHARVKDDDVASPWNGPRAKNLGANIYYNRALFEEVTHGNADVHIGDVRRLCWLRLRPRSTSSSTSTSTFLVATVHLLASNPKRVTQDKRMKQATAVASTLASVALPDEPVFLAGDFNDNYQPFMRFSAAGFHVRRASAHVTSFHLSAPYVHYACSHYRSI